MLKASSQLETSDVVCEVLDERTNFSCQFQWWSCPWLSESYCFLRHRNKCELNCLLFSALSCSSAVQSHSTTTISHDCALPWLCAAFLISYVVFKLTGYKFPCSVGFLSLDSGRSFPTRLIAFTEIALQTHCLTVFALKAEVNANVLHALHFS